MKEFLELGFINREKRRKEYWFLTLAIFASITIILFFFTLRIGGYQLIESELRRNTWANDVLMFPGLLDNHSNLPNSREDFTYFCIIEEIKRDYAISSIVVEHRKNDIDFRVYFDDKEFSPPFEFLKGIDVHYETFSYTSIQYREQKDDEFETIIYGRVFVPGDKRVAVIDENTARMLDFDRMEEIVGQEFLFLNEGAEKIAVKIIGVYSSELGPTSQLLEESILRKPLYCSEGLRDIFLNSIIVSSDVICSLNRNSESTVSSILFSGENFEAALKLYTTLSLMTNYQISSEAEFIVSAFENMSLFASLFGLIGIILLILSFLNLYTIALLNAEKRKKWFALQNILGFEIKHIWIVYVSEIAINIFKGFVLAVTLCIVSIFLFDVIVENLLNFTFDSLILLKAMFGMAILLLFIVLLFIGIVALVFNVKLRKLNVIQILF